MKKTYKKIEEKLTSEGAELRQPVAELEALETDYMQTGQLLRKTEVDKLDVLNSISEFVIHQDTEHKILWTNRAAAESVGLTPEQLVERHCYEIWLQRSQPCEGCPVAKARQTGKPQQAEITIPGDRTLFIRGYPILDEYDRVTGIIELVLNVTERKKAEQALQAEKNKLQSLIDAMEDDLSIQDKSYNIIYQNESSKVNHGDRLGEKCYRTYEGRNKICRGCPVEKAFEDGKSHTSERKVVTLSGEVAFFENTANPIINAGGEMVACLEVGRNITERKRAEEREQEMQRELLLSSRLAAIGELAAGVAHQINNPLTGVLGFSQRLLKKSTDQETKQDLKIIYTEAERAAKVVQNLLTFARRRQPHKQYSDINEILESALELRSYELKTSNIEVITNLAAKLPEIMLDFFQLQEVFLNLILNAEQALTEAHNGGNLTIKTEERKGYIRTTFTDDGPGIPAERLDNIFDPFYTTKAEKGGTGLGLSICHGIITEHGGKIYAKSKPGKGATFFVELPLTHN
jgi:PAS domain S-box-containing protein